MFKLTKDAISKNSIIFKVFLKKFFEFLLCHQIFGLKATFLLVLLLNYYLAEKQNNKKNPIEPIRPNDFETVLILLVQMIAI